MSARVVWSNSDYGKVCIPVGSWSEELRDIIEAERPPVIRLSSSMGWLGTDVSFLADVPGLAGVEIYANAISDARVISRLRGLRLLGLDLDLKENLALGDLMELEVLKIRWHRLITGWMESASLRTLNVMNWPDRDIIRLAGLARLQSLSVTSRTITSLLGAGDLSCLGSVDLAMCPQLVSIDALRNLPITRLSLSRCSRLQGVEVVGSLSRLEVLSIDDCGELSSLAPLAGCQRLRELKISGTTIIKDGDFSFMDHIESLRRARFVRRKHYNRGPV